MKKRRAAGPSQIQLIEIEKKKKERKKERKKNFFLPKKISFAQVSKMKVLCEQDDHHSALHPSPPPFKLPLKFPAGEGKDGRTLFVRQKKKKKMNT